MAGISTFTRGSLGFVRHHESPSKSNCVLISLSKCTILTLNNLELPNRARYYDVATSIAASTANSTLSMPPYLRSPSVPYRGPSTFRPRNCQKRYSGHPISTTIHTRRQKCPNTKNLQASHARCTTFEASHQ